MHKAMNILGAAVYISCIVTKLRGRRSGVRIPSAVIDVSVSQNVQTVSAAHEDSYSINTGGYFSVDKAAGARSGPLTTSSSEVKNLWRCVFHLYVFMVRRGVPYLVY